MTDSTTEITNETIRAALHKLVEEKLKTKDYEIDVNAGSKHGDNFIGIVYRVTYWRKDKPNEKSKLIVKVSPQNQARRERFFSRPSFLREMYMYGEVLPALRELEESKGVIVKEDGFHEYPEYYTSVDAEPWEAVFLEDLKEGDFVMLNHRTEPLTAEHVKLVMRSLGKFHADSLALKNQQPDKFKALTSKLEDIFVRKDDKNMQDFLNYWPTAVIAAITEPEDAHILEKVKKLYERKQMDIAAECVDSEAAEPFTVVCHGDLWTNNTMFKYNDKHEPIDMRFLDYQISRYSSPAVDLAYYFYCCTTKELRDKHYESFLKTYHESLSNQLRRLGMDPDKLFPYDALLDQLRKFGKFGLVMSSIFLPLMCGEEGGNPDMNELAESMQDGKVLEADVFVAEDAKAKLNRRLRDVVADMVNFGYI